MYNLQPALKGWSCEGASVDSSMPKSGSFLLKVKNSTMDDVMIAYLFVAEWVSIYREKLWLLFLLDSDTVSPPIGWGVSFFLSWTDCQGIMEEP